MPTLKKKSPKGGPAGLIGWGERLQVSHQLQAGPGEGQVWKDSRSGQEACCQPGLHLAHTAVPSHQGTGSQEKSYSRGARDKARDKAVAV